MPSVRVDCTDEVLCALRAKQCELDILVDANKVGLKHLYSKCQESLTQQQLEEKADLLDSKVMVLTFWRKPGTAPVGGLFRAQKAESWNKFK